MELNDIPRLGIGIGYRLELRQLYAKHRDRIDWFEVIADHYFRSVPERAEHAVELSKHIPLIPHGLELSIGSDGPLDMDYVDQAAELVRVINAPFYSDHLCFTKAHGLEMGQLTPLPFTEAVASRCAAKARQVKEAVGVPFLLENITYAFKIPGQMSEAAFITKVLTEGDIGLLLDLTNVFINSQNHNYDPYEFLDALPLDRVVQVHLAGGIKVGDRWVDSHSHPVDSHPEVWGLLDYVVKNSPLKAVLLERDQNFPEAFDDILADLDKAREIFDTAPEAVA